MVSLSDICLFPEKMTLFFFYPQQISTYSFPVYTQLLCRIIECPAKCTSFNLIYCTRAPGSLENEPVLISGKIIWGKTILL